MSASIPPRFILDTNIVSAFFKKELVIGEAIFHAQRVYLPTIVLGELHFGAKKSQSSEKHLQRISRFLPLVEVIHITQETAEIYGGVKAGLETKGQLIPDCALSGYLRDNIFRIVAENGSAFSP